MTSRACFRSLTFVSVVLGGASLALASCSLNPQPEPPGAADSATPTGAATGAGGSGAGGKSIASGGGGGAGKVSAGGSDLGIGGGGGHAAGGSHGGGASAGSGGASPATGGSGGGTSIGGAGGGAGGPAAGTGGGNSSGGTNGQAGGGVTGQGGGATGEGGGSSGQAGAMNPSGGAGGGTGDFGGSGGGAGTDSGAGGSATAGSGGSGAAGSGGSDPTGEACGAFAVAYCARLAACAPFVLATTWGGSATCEKETADGCVAELGGVDMPPPAQKKTCAAALGSATCDDVLGTTGLPAGCIPSAPGPRLLGATCGSDAQCATDFCDAAKSGCGVCAARPTAGDACSASGRCGPGLVCGPMSHCTAARTIGQTCDGDCAPSLACIGGTCVSPGKQDAPCQIDADCDRPNGFACDGSSNTCQSIPTSTAGQTCDDLASLPAVCVGGTYCTADGLCAPRTSPGTGACQSTIPDSCFAPAQCIVGNAMDYCVYETLSCP